MVRAAIYSPLVRAAKATGRLNKKPGFVITNETLLKTGGHIGVASAEMQSQPMPKPFPLYVQPQQARKPVVVDTTKAKAEAARQLALGQAAAEYENNTTEQRQIDPAMQEHQMQQLQMQSPPAKPPQE